jgi:TRAP-type C4-dicarboxylate transport system permease small subunit
MRFIQAIDRGIGTISRFLMTLSGISTLIMGFLVTYAIFQRYFLSKPSDEAYEITMMLLILCAITAIPAVERTGAHIRVDFLVNFMPKPVQIFLLKLFGPTVGIFYAVVLIWKGFTAGLYSLKIQEVSNTNWAQPLYPMKLLIPIFYIFFLIVLVFQFGQGIVDFRKELKKNTSVTDKTKIDSVEAGQG